MEIKKDQYYIVRADRAGVFFGKVAFCNTKEITMQEVRKLFYWDGACAVEELAVNGTTRPDNCRFTLVVPEMVIANPIQVIPCSESAAKIIKAVPEWKRK